MVQESRYVLGVWPIALSSRISLGDMWEKAAFWMVLAIAFGLLSLWSWRASRGPLRTLDALNRSGTGMRVRLEGQPPISPTKPIGDLLKLMSWTGTVGFLLAVVAAMFTAVFES